VCEISGTVRYYRDAAGTTEPSPKPVAEIDVDLIEDGQPPAATDASGAYAFADQNGTRTVVVADELGAPRAAHHNGAIGSLDAAFTLQAAVGSLVLSENQTVAGDVSGNGALSAFDAGMIAQFAAELLDHFPVATDSGSDWAFLRCDNYVDASTHDCTTPEYVFDPLSQTESADFYAILYGDPTGNWQPAAALAGGGQTSHGSTLTASVTESAEALAFLRTVGGTAREPAVPADRERARAALAAAAAPGGSATLRLDGLHGPIAAGERREIVVRIDDPVGVVALDLTLEHDPAAVRIVGIDTAEAGRALGLASRTEAGRTRVALYGLTPLDASGALVVVTVEATAAAPRGIALELSGQADEGSADLRIVRGRERDRSRTGEDRRSGGRR
jgi:hypothetical protein